MSTTEAEKRRQFVHQSIPECRKSQKISPNPSADIDDRGSASPVFKSPSLNSQIQLPTLKQLKEKHKHSKDVEYASVQTRVTPLSSYSYFDQMKMKVSYLRTTMKQLTRAVFHECQSTSGSLKPQWCHPEVAKGFHGCSVEVPEEFLPVESRIGYRNKCEFIIGYSNAESTEIEVGYVRSFHNFEPLVGSSSGCINTPAAMQEICNRMKLLAQSSKIPVYSRKKKEGLWRLLLVRHSRALNEMMIVVQIDASASEADESKVRAIIMEGLVCPSDSRDICNDSDSILIEARVVYASIDTHPPKSKEGFYLYDGSSIASVYLQKRSAPSDAFDSDPCIHIWGKRYIEMEICGLRFHVSPTSFFQSNLVACEALYRLVIDWLAPDPQGIVLDICSGAGTVSLCLSNILKNTRVIGIEIMEGAVHDANESAQGNKLDQNVTFIAGSAEDVLPKLLNSNLNKSQNNSSSFNIAAEIIQNQKGEICAVVDPPRCGLHTGVLSTIRQSEKINKLIYVSCNPASLLDDALRLCSVRFDNSAPFYPVRSTLIDMFPHTFHCEAVVEFLRVKEYAQSG